jgi:putative copper resistance protein D
MSSTLGPDRSGTGPLVLAGAACAVAIALLVVLVTRTPWWSPGGLPDAGEVTRNGVAVLKVLVTVASVVCVGSLLAAAFLLPRQRNGRVDADGHPALHTAAVAASGWLVGCLVLLLATSSGVGRYAPAVFSAHLTQQVLLAVVAPVLLVRGAPLLLALRAARRDGAPREWLTALPRSRGVQVLTRPAVGFALLVVPMVLLYAAGGFTAVVGNRWAHLAMNAHALLAGYLVLWPLAGADPLPRRVPAAGRIGALVALLLGFAALAVVVTNSPTVLGADFYWSLALSWTGDLLADQRLGAVALWVGGLPVLAVLTVLLTTRSTVNGPASTSV